MKTTTEQTKEPITNVSERDDAIKWFDNLHEHIKKTVAEMYFYGIDTDTIASTLIEYAPKEEHLPEKTLTEHWDIKKDVSETVEEAANNHSKLSWGIYYNDLHPDSAINDCAGVITEKDFKAGAEWQKQQSDTIIKELAATLTTLESIFSNWSAARNDGSYTNEIEFMKSALSKANEYLNK